MRFKLRLLWFIIPALLTLITSGNQAKKPEETVSFSREVFPIILTNCSTMACHGNGQTPVLLTHKKISKYSKRIANRITYEKNPMPPISSNKKLSKDEIKTLLSWIKQGSQNN